MAKNRHHHTSRIENYELLEQRARQRRVYDQQSEDGQYLDRPTRTLGINTMEAPEELVARKRNHRSRVVMAAPANENGNPLVENAVILVLLILSIYGLYRLSIYLLAQAS